MLRRFRLSYQTLGVLFLAVGVSVAQQTVTNNNDGAANTVPVYSGSAILRNSPIVATTSGVGIGTYPIRELTINNGEMSLIPYTSGGATNYGYFNLSDANGNNGSNMTLVIRGIGSGGSANNRLANVILDASTATLTSNVSIGGNVTLQAGSGASITFPDGTVQGTAYTGTCSASGGDYAESIDVTGDRKEFEPGDVLVIDPASPGHFLKATTPYSNLVSGIYSTKPGYVGRRQATDPKTSQTEVPMAMVGIVPTKVTTENGPIQPGDLLVSSSKPGYAMHGTDAHLLTGAVVGKALGHMESGTGVIEVLVSLQ